MINKLEIIGLNFSVSTKNFNATMLNAQEIAYTKKYFGIVIEILFFELKVRFLLNQNPKKTPEITPNVAEIK